MEVCSNSIYAPWFYVEYEIDYGDWKPKSILLLNTLDHLDEISSRSDIKITQAHVVTPVYLNNSNDWKMDRLSQVLKATRKIKGNEIPVTIYILSDGRKLTDSQITEKSKLKNQGIVFTH
ncbi:hypothetical protein Mfla_2555 [Methylobacillus flagellatus KT]|uniref:Uncharacterized protein n=1 Tax=Methylobacillus flagellatus (strain ATCC 51484 / DSM 6875 / VKM B-1610 / KT) TaxID=265072 RepID=Q1GY67_METFK|nr:hypothetical protein Mfla_2555 [Methylobacillus flagellatus KT]